MQLRVEFIDELSICDLRQEMHLIVSPCDQHPIFIPVDRVEGVGVLPSVEQEFVGLRAVSDVVYARQRATDLPWISFQYTTLPFIPQVTNSDTICVSSGTAIMSIPSSESSPIPLTT